MSNEALAHQTVEPTRAPAVVFEFAGRRLFRGGSEALVRVRGNRHSDVSNARLIEGEETLEQRALRLWPGERSMDVHNREQWLKSVRHLRSFEPSRWVLDHQAKFKFVPVSQLSSYGRR